jgi:uncharacterized protein YegJ (DUF2314 family)
MTNGYYSVVFYFAPTPAANTLLTAKMLTKSILPTVPFLENPKNPPAPPFVGFEEEQAPLKDFPVPDASYFKYAGRGLTKEDITAFQKTDRATRLVLIAPREDVWRIGRKFTELVLEFATATGAYVWDSATRECFHRKAWNEKRLARWPSNAIPDITHQVTIHLYHPKGASPYLRAITLGMEKFALPDVVIERMIGSDNRPAGNLINFVCQSLAERPMIRSGAKETFRLGALESETLRTNMQSSLKQGATSEVTLALVRGSHQDGDPENKLMELDFRHGNGKTEDERREDLLSKLWGSNDSIVGVKHDEDILEASRRARIRLNELRPAFDKGLPPGSRLLVKAPFARDDEGNEWMWVEVMKWTAVGSIEGVLQNEPFYIRKLKAGSKVQVKASEIFDYKLYREDGTTEGNETGKLMQKQGGPIKNK